MKGLIIQAAVCLVTLATFDVLLGSYEASNQIPQRKMKEALRKQGNLLVFSGDSRAVAAVDYEIIRGQLSAAECDLTVVDLALESTDATWQILALQKYLKHKRKLSGVVLGFTTDLLLAEPEAFSPDTWYGPLTTNFLWAQPEDIDLMYPGFPLSNLDVGLRFYLNRTTHLGIYKPVLWHKWQLAQESLLFGTETGERNQFGRVEDMKELAQRFASGGRERLLRYRDGEGWKLNPLFEKFRLHLKERQIPLILVELPMSEHYQREVSQSAEGRAFRSWLRHRIESDGGLYLDFSQPAWMTDEFIPDRSHINPEGARLISRDLGEDLAIFYQGRHCHP